MSIGVTGHPTQQCPAKLSGRSKRTISVRLTMRVINTAWWTGMTLIQYTPTSSSTKQYLPLVVVAYIGEWPNCSATASAEVLISSAYDETVCIITQNLGYIDECFPHISLELSEKVLKTGRWTPIYDRERDRYTLSFRTLAWFQSSTHWSRLHTWKV